MEVLVVGAHTDDEHGMSGLIHLLARDGHTIRLVITTDTEGKVGERHNEMRAAAEILGIESVHYLGEPDGKLCITPEVQAKFNELCDSLPKPDVVFVMHPVDVHPDHRRTAELVMSRCYQRGVNTPLFFYALNSSGRAFDYIRPQSIAFFPTHYCDVSSVVETMKEADSKHITQDAPAMWKGVEANLRGRGNEMTKLLNNGKGFFSRKQKVEVKFAEGFVFAERLYSGGYAQTPAWLEEFLVEKKHDSAGIPFEVTPKSIGVE